MKPRELPPLSTLHKHYEYNPNTGELIKIKKTSRRCKLGPVGSLTSQGYLITSLFGQKLLVHRACYKIFYGVEPEIIDHIDGNKLNNKIDNLRSVSHTENNRNRLKAKGVTRIKSGSYRATIWVNGRNEDIGYFGDEESAVKAYNERRKELGWIK